MEDSLLFTLNPLVLSIGALCMGIAGVIAARVFSGTHDIKKSILLYLPIALVIAVILVLLAVPVIISLGLIGFGLIVLIYASNHYFYK